MPGEPDDAVVEKVAKALREFDLSEANAGLLTDEEFHGFYHNAARAAIAAARPLIEREAWRPIETFEPQGPEDGRVKRVLIATVDGIVGEACYRNSDGPDHEAWWWANENGGDYYAEPISPAPTHWMPLPAPPALASSEQGEG